MALTSWENLPAATVKKVQNAGAYCLGSDGNWYPYPVDQTSGTIPISGSFSSSNDTNYGVVGSNTLRTGAQIGNATGAADFNTGAAGAQTLRTVLAARSEAAATPLSNRLSDGAAFYTGAKTGQLPSALGQTTMAGSVSVAIASNQSAIAVTSNSTIVGPFGQTTDTASIPVVIANNQSAIPVVFGVTDFGSSAAATRVAAILGSASGAVDYNTGAAGAQTLRTVLSTRSEAAATPLSMRLSTGAAFYDGTKTGQLPSALGQLAMAASVSVAIASDQSSVPVTVGSSALPTGAATEATLSAMSAKLPSALGQTTMAASMSVAIASNQSAIPFSQSGALNITNISGTVSLPTGASTEATLAAQSAKFPATIGQKAMSGSLAVALASDQTSIPVTIAAAPLYPTGLNAVLITRDFSSTNATTAYSNLDSALAANTYKGITVFDSGGGATKLAYILGWGSADKLYIPAGGIDGFIPLAIPASQQLQIKTVSGTQSTGYLYINCFY